MTINTGGSSQTPSGPASNVAVTNFPADYPDAGTHTRLDTLHSDNTSAKSVLDAMESALTGAGSIGLTGATVSALQTAFTNAQAQLHTDLQGIAGDLSDIYAELLQKFESGDLVGMDQTTLDGIGNAVATLFHYPTDYPSSAANTKLDTLHADLTGPLSIRNSVVEAASLSAAALNADLIPATNVTAYKTISLQIAGTWVGQLDFQGSNDGTNYLPVASQTASTQTSSGQTGTPSNGLFRFPVNFKFFRVRFTAWTSGTATGTAEYFSLPGEPLGIGATIQGNSASSSADTGNPIKVGGVYNSTQPTLTTGQRADAQTTARGASIVAPGVEGFATTDVALTNGTQVTKITNGTQTADTVANDSGQNSLIVGRGRKEVTFTTTTVQPVALTDVSNYNSVSVHITSQGTSSTITFQGSNDNVNWASMALYNAGAAYTSTNGSVISTTASGGIFGGSMPYRFFRLSVTGISAGTTAGVVEFFTQATPQNTNGAVQAVQNGAWTSTVTPNGTVGSPPPATAFPMAATDGTNLTALRAGGTDTLAAKDALNIQNYLYNGSTYERKRGATIFKTATATASGDTALWTPTSGKKFRVMAFRIDITANASQAVSGDFDVLLRDSTTSLSLALSAFVPSVALTTFASNVTTGWTPLGNGPLSAAANNVLNINLSAALVTGRVRCFVIGIEE